MRFGPLWTRALLGYTEDPNAIARLLPMMATAHIIEDLPDAIYHCRTVTKDQYDAVFHHIKRCIDTTRRSHHISYNAWADILEEFKLYVPIPTNTIRFLLAVGIAVAWLPPLLDPAIRKMRDVAWGLAQAKVRISQAP